MLEWLRAALLTGEAMWRQRDLTLFAKTVVILLFEVALNALVWIITGILFSRTSANQEKLLGLALIAWTTGLRHGLDADHISAIDNATRRIVSVPFTDHRGSSRLRRPVTVGLFFSLGHSTIVIVTIVAIAISA
jgi:high-affinity nickel-transport protein